MRVLDQERYIVDLSQLYTAFSVNNYMEDKAYAWIGEAPNVCEFCNKRLSDDKYFYEFHVEGLSDLAIGCERCFNDRKGKLGFGIGKKFKL